jgi:hypothetical protein
MLTDENSVVLRGVVRGDVQFMLLNVRPTPARRRMFLLHQISKGALIKKTR